MPGLVTTCLVARLIRVHSPHLCVGELTSTFFYGSSILPSRLAAPSTPPARSASSSSSSASPPPPTPPHHPLRLLRRRRGHRLSRAGMRWERARTGQVCGAGVRTHAREEPRTRAPVVRAARSRERCRRRRGRRGGGGPTCRRSPLRLLRRRRAPLPSQPPWSVLVELHVQGQQGREGRDNTGGRRTERGIGPSSMSASCAESFATPRRWTSAAATASSPRATPRHPTLSSLAVEGVHIQMHVVLCQGGGGWRTPTDCGRWDERRRWDEQQEC